MKKIALVMAFGGCFALSHVMVWADSPAEHRTLDPQAMTQPLLDLSQEFKSTHPEETQAKEKSMTVQDNEIPHWDYTGKTGPDHWGDLHPSYALCGQGKHQSPIDLQDDGALETKGMPSLEMYYGQTPLAIENNGHTIRVNFPVGNSYMKIGHTRYELLHLQFHTPSEHQLNGFHYPLEMQLVHRNHEGQLAILAILFREGEENAFLVDLMPHLPKDRGKHRYEQVKVAPAHVFPGSLMFYRYAGSLTTPPCSEGVKWIVFKQAQQVSYEQIQALAEIMGNNNRPVMAKEAREVLKSWYLVPELKPSSASEPMQDIFSY